MNDALHMLLGAALVAVGVIVTAIADRIRGLRVQRARDVEARAPKAPLGRAFAPEERAVLPVIATVTRKAAAARDEVVAALTSSGYPKRDAAHAVDACTLAERATLESWTRAALQRAAGGAS